MSPGTDFARAQHCVAQQVIKVEIVSASPLIFLAAVPCVLPTFQLVGAGKLSWSFPVLLPSSHSAMAIGMLEWPHTTAEAQTCTMY